MRPWMWIVAILGFPVGTVIVLLVLIARRVGPPPSDLLARSALEHYASGTRYDGGRRAREALAHMERR